MSFLKRGLTRTKYVCRIAQYGFAIIVAGALIQEKVNAQSYDLSAGFSRTNNPNGRWTYGWVGSLGGVFTPLSVQHISTVDGGKTIPSWQLTSGEAPVVYKNVSTNTLSAGGGLVSFAPSEVWFNPGENGRTENFGVIRFTAPSNGLYQIETGVRPVYTGSPQGDTDFHVLKNGVELFGEFLSPTNSAAYSNSVSLVAGDTIDFAIGRGADGNAYGSGLRIQAALTSSAPFLPPTSFSDFSLGRDFSAANNPNGAWSYGWQGNLGEVLTVLTVQHLSPAGNGVITPSWQLTSYQTPAIYHNPTTNTAIFGNNLGTLVPNGVLFYPGENGRPENFGVIRFTAPSNGSYRVETAVAPVYDGNPQGDTDFHVLKNGTELFSQFLPTTGAASYSNVVSLVGGGTVDFAIGRGADGSQYGSGLKIQATITPVDDLIPPIPAGLVVNGSFELGVNPGVSSDVSAPNSTTIMGWTVETASVDYIGSRWTAGDGVRCLDLSGTDAATISQTISGLTPGQHYRLSFLMAANPEVGAITARLSASIGGASQEYSFVQSGFSTANLGWTEKALDFTASASEHKLSFVSLNPGWAGAALDYVAIVAATNDIPQPPVAVTHNLGRDFALTNPNGAWSYGYQSAIGAPFNLMDSRQTVQSENGLPILLWHTQSAPAIYANTNAVTAISGGEAYPPNIAWCYAGPEGSARSFAVMRFTVPANEGGVYLIASAVAPRISSGGDDSDYHVAKNGSELFGQFLGATESGGYTNSLELQPGDTIDFLVGRGANGRLYGSGLKIQATVTRNAITTPPIPAGLVANGGFELGVDPGVSSDVSAPNSTTITGWTVETASVDYIGSRWTAGDGVRCLDLSGTDAATISQMIAGLTPGQHYRLSFLMAANPEVGAITARLSASIGGASQEYSFVQPGFTTDNLGWTEKTLDFTASTSEHKLSFVSLNPGWAGAALDHIAIVPVTNLPPAGLVANGSFELGVDPGVSSDVSAPDSTTITGWTVETASVDYIGSRWTAGDGIRCLDLSGTDAATISQMISGLTVGQTYRLSFLMAANPEVGLLRARLRASIGDASEEFEFLQSSTSTAHLGWLSNRLEFTAGASSHKLSFTSLNPGWAGAALDLVAIVALTNPPPAGLVANGGFELGVDPGVSSDVAAPNSTTITGWTVETASVDYIGSRWTAGDGVRCLDLSGTDAATISQAIIGLTPGQRYRLSFLMAANPEVGAITARLRASIGGASQEYSFVQSGFSTANLGWTENTLDFTASAWWHKLSFVSLNPGWAGAALDRVAIKEIDTPPGGLPAPAGLVSWWQAEGNANDSVSSNHGLLMDGANIGAGKVGRAFSFDGIDDVVRVPASASLDVGAGLGVTIELWVNPEQLSVQSTLLEWASPSAPEPGLHLWTSVFSPGSLFANLTDVNGVAHHFTSPADVLTVGVFQHVAFSYDKTSGIARLFVNGVQVAENNMGSLTLDTRPDLWFGRRILGGGTQYLFKGQMDEISLYNRALAGSEVAAIFNAGSAGKTPSTTPPVNHAPVAKALAAPLFTVWPDQTNLMVIAVDGLEADIQFDASLSSDADNDALAFLWSKDDEGTPFGAGVLTTNAVEVGAHSVVLLASDAATSGTDTLLIEVITLGDAVDEVYGVLIESDVVRKDKRPLLTTLDRVWNSFEDGRLKAGVRQLEAFQKKVHAQVSGRHPALARRLIGTSQQIIDAVESYLEQNPHGPSHGGKDDEKKK